MTFVGIVVYVVVQILLLPLGVIGVIFVTYRQMWTSRKLGVSSTAIEVINGRWTMDLFGIRGDAACRKLNRTLPNNSVVGMWLALFPLYLLHRMTGKNLIYPKVPAVGEEGIADIVVARTIYFDEIIERTKSTVEQFVLLGAGFDTRAYGGLHDGSLGFFELDQKETQRLKKASLNRAGVASDHVTYVEVDFSQDSWYENLLQSGFDRAKKTIFLWEGVTLYLSRSDVCTTLKDIQENSAQGSVLIADFYAESFVAGDYLTGMKIAKNVLKLTDEEFGFGLNFAVSGSDPVSALTQFIESQQLRVGQCKFLAAASRKGPFMVVAEVLC